MLPDEFSTIDLRGKVTSFISIEASCNLSMLKKKNKVCYTASWI